MKRKNTALVGAPGCRRWHHAYLVLARGAIERTEDKHDRGTEGCSRPPGGRALLRAVHLAGDRRGRLFGGGFAGGDQRGGAPELETGRRDARPHERWRHPGVGHVGVLLGLGASRETCPRVETVRRRR